MRGPGRPRIAARARLGDAASVRLLLGVWFDCVYSGTVSVATATHRLGKVYLDIRLIIRLIHLPLTHAGAVPIHTTTAQREKMRFSFSVPLSVRRSVTLFSFFCFPKTYDISELCASDCTSYRYRLIHTSVWSE